MNRYEQRIAAFYAAFRELDAAQMKAAYAPNAQFHDPVFRLDGRDEIGAMWAMLCEATRKNGRDVWRLDFSDIAGDAKHGRAHWEATYRFSATGRMVRNVIDAAFTFDDKGLILTHRDRFDFWLWARQAMGPAGWALGWTPLMQNKVRAKARGNLEAFRLARSRPG